MESKERKYNALKNISAYKDKLFYMLLNGHDTMNWQDVNRAVILYEQLKQNEQRF